MLYMVMYKDQEIEDLQEYDVDRLCFRDDLDQPAVYDQRSDAVKYMQEMQDLYPDTAYFVRHFTPIEAVPEPTL